MFLTRSPCFFVPDGVRNRAYVLRSCAAAAADYVEQALVRHPAYAGRHFFGAVVVAAHLVRHSGVGEEQQRERGETVDFAHQRQHLFGTECTVDAQSDQPGSVRNRNRKGLERLSCQHPAAAVADRCRNHHRHRNSEFFKCLYRSLGVERIEPCFQKDKVNTAFEQSVYLYFVRVLYLIETEAPCCRIVGIAAHR